MALSARMECPDKFLVLVVTKETTIVCRLQEIPLTSIQEQESLAPGDLELSVVFVFCYAPAHIPGKHHTV